MTKTSRSSWRPDPGWTWAWVETARDADGRSAGRLMSVPIPTTLPRPSVPPPATEEEKRAQDARRRRLDYERQFEVPHETREYHALKYWRNRNDGRR